ncbi:hypothetical protein BSL78_01934 [Apostichopus japonicus]|uniref:EGF-like domain-containing protein n=1 Tax=Stichopus japonicus TaxID=307972 RepID=A0A2G8LLI1_STIJA|nr:hypothetical protein BSL78_01934 [Apostichopus japonicus]
MQLTWIKGAVFGADNIRVGANLKLYNTGYSDCLNCTDGSTDLGEYWFRNLQILSQGVLTIVSSKVRDVASPRTIHLIISDAMEMDYTSDLIIQDGVIITSEVIFVENTCQITADGNGYGADSGPGVGAAYSAGGGGGGRVRTYSLLPSAVFSRSIDVTGGRNLNDNNRVGGTGTVCQSGAECSMHGTWSATSGRCLCDDGYVGFNCQIECSSEIRCNGNGVCEDNGGCLCDFGYAGYRCEYQCTRRIPAVATEIAHPWEPVSVILVTTVPHALYSAAATAPVCTEAAVVMPALWGDTAILNAVITETVEIRPAIAMLYGLEDVCSIRAFRMVDCSGNGVCNVYGLCYCDPAFTGDDCSIPDCPGTPDCDGKGTCSGTYDPPRCINCDAGWMGTGCELECLHGTPEETDGKFTCTCDPCWTGKGCNTVCTGHGECNNGSCNCDPLQGWRGAVCQIPGCPGFGEDCTGHGDCNSALHECSCDPGWTGVGCHVPDCPGEPDCFDRGFCNTTYESPRCTECEKGWMGRGCEIECTHGVHMPMNSDQCLCDPGWVGISCNSECSGHGVIVNDICICDYDTGWKGEVCDVPGCPGLFNLDCSGRGACESAQHICTCDAGWRGLGCEVADCPGEPDCNNYIGICDDSFDPPRCVNCSDGWMGEACEEPCIFGYQDPPNSGNCHCLDGYSGVGCDAECSTHGEVKDGICNCDKEWKGPLCDIPGCPGKFGKDCSGRGECNSATHKCVCENGWTGEGCELPDCPGEPNCNNNGTCSEEYDPPQCIDCIPGWMGADCGEVCLLANRAIQTQGYVCNCFNGYQSADCSYECANGHTNATGFCVCDPCYNGFECNFECSGHGSCDKDTLTCKCNNNEDEGYLGPLCEITGCPGLDGNCNGHGTCEGVDKECACYPGWRGSDCSQPDCPGEPGSCSDSLHVAVTSEAEVMVLVSMNSQGGVPVIQNGLEKLAMFPVRMDITMATAAGASVILVTTARDAVKYVSGKGTCTDRY